MPSDKKHKDKNKSMFGGLTGKAERGMKSRTNRIDRAVNKASNTRNKKSRKDKK